MLPQSSPSRTQRLRGDQLLLNLQCLRPTTCICAGAADASSRSNRKLKSLTPISLDQTTVSGLVQQDATSAIRAAASGRTSAQAATTSRSPGTFRNRASFFSGIDISEGGRHRRHYSRKLAGSNGSAYFGRGQQAGIATLTAQAATADAIYRAANGQLHPAAAARTGVVTGWLATQAAQGSSFAANSLFQIDG